MSIRIMSRVNICDTFGKRYEDIKNLLYDLYDILDTDKSPVSKENFVFSVIDLMFQYICKTNYFGIQKEILHKIMIISVTCYWIVDKWENDSYNSLKTYEAITKISCLELKRMEINILVMLNFKICEWMPGYTPCTITHKNELAPVMKELKEYFRKI